GWRQAVGKQFPDILPPVCLDVVLSYVPDLIMVTIKWESNETARDIDSTFLVDSQEWKYLEHKMVFLHDLGNGSKSILHVDNVSLDTEMLFRQSTRCTDPQLISAYIRMPF